MATQVGGVRPAPAPPHQGPDQRPDHLVAERPGLDLEAQQCAPAPSGQPDLAARQVTGDPRTMGWSAAVPGGRRQKPRKSCSPTRASAAAAMARRSSGSATCQASGARSGSGTGAFQHQVAVVAAGGRAAGVEPGGGRGRRADHHRRGQLAVERPDRRPHGSRPLAHVAARRAGRRGPPGPGRAPRRRSGRRR